MGSSARASGKRSLAGAEKIGAAATKILQRHHGHRYFTWELRKGQFHYFPHPVKLPREQACEGKYLIQTEEPGISPVEAVAAYKQLNEVERGFAHLKGLLEVRPIYHHKDDRVRAHVFVAALAFLLDRGLEKKLRAANSTLRHRGTRQASEVSKAVGLTELDPPLPPKGKETLL
jgi:hypothetical protein